MMSPLPVLTLVLVLLQIAQSSEMMSPLPVLTLVLVLLQIAQSSEMMSPLLGSALRVLLHMLGLNQSVLVLQNMFAIQRALVTKV